LASRQVPLGSQIKWQKQALQLIDEKDKVEYQSRLDLYKAHKPFREEPKK